MEDSVGEEGGGGAQHGQLCTPVDGSDGPEEEVEANVVDCLCDQDDTVENHGGDEEKVRFFREGVRGEEDTLDEEENKYPCQGAPVYKCCPAVGDEPCHFCVLKSLGRHCLHGLLLFLVRKKKNFVHVGKFPLCESIRRHSTQGDLAAASVTPGCLVVVVSLQITIVRTDGFVSEGRHAEPVLTSSLD